MKKKYKYRLKETLREGLETHWTAQYIEECDFEKYGKDDMMWGTIYNFFGTSKEEAIKAIALHKTQKEPIIKYHEA